MKNRIQLIGGGRPEIPADFVSQLRAFDPSLYVSWNDVRKRFVIEQCVQHFAPRPEHDHTCRRIYVWLVRDEDDDSMLPLGPHVLVKLASIDVARQGYGPNDLKRWCDDRQKEDDANRANVARLQAESVINARKDNRRQLLRAVHLMQQHSLSVNQ